MFNWILIALGTIIVLPILAFLCVKLGTVGFYRGKEAFKRQSEIVDSVQSNDNEIES